MTKTKKQRQQEKRLKENVKQATKHKKDFKTKIKKVKNPVNQQQKKKGGFFASLLGRLFGSKTAPQTAQQSIPYKTMYKDGICRVNNKLYTKTITFSDINYQLAQNEDKTQIFDGYCGFLNYFDSTISVQLSFINKYGNIKDFEQAIDIPEREDDYNSIRREYVDMLKNQLAKGNNGLIKQKYITFGIEASSLREAKPKLERIEADIMGNFRVLGVKSMPLNGSERLAVLHGQLHPDGKDIYQFDWNVLPETGLSTKDFIAPTSFDFRGGKTFCMGTTIGAVSFIQIIAPELSDRLLADYLEMNNAITVNLHIKSINQTEAIKTIKRKITELDAMKINEVRPDRAKCEAV